MNTDFETEFETRSDRASLESKFWRFARYLSTRRIECWGFFIAGLMIGGIFF